MYEYHTPKFPKNTDIPAPIIAIIGQALSVSVEHLCLSAFFEENYEDHNGMGTWLLLIDWWKSVEKGWNEAPLPLPPFI